jgi:8-oxo-dGTP diphosphatase
VSKIVFGTSNPAKVEKVRQALADTGVEVVGISELRIDEVEVEEKGETAQGNARIKAVAYAKSVGEPVLSVDSGLYIEGLENNEQPGPYMRRIGDKRSEATDNELIEYYSELIESLGGEAKSRVIDAFCIATPEGKVFENTIVSERELVSKPCKTKVKGHPLDSLQVDEKIGKYFAEMSEEEKGELWQRLIGVELRRFLRESLQKIAEED